MSSIVVASYRPFARLTLFVVMAAVTSAAVLGLGLAVVAVADRDQGPARLGDRVATSFGVVAVSDVSALSDSHAGQGHAGHFSGPGSIPEDKVAVEVSVTLANTTDHEVAYSPDAFLLRLGARGSRLANSEATFFRGTLLPGGVLDGQLTFLVPRDESTGALEFADPGRTDPIVIDLGVLSESGAGHDDGHDH